MFRLVSFFVFAGITAGLVWTLRSQLIQVAGTKQMLRRQGQDLWGALRQWRVINVTSLLRLLRKALYFLTLISFLILAITGFLPVIISGSPISGLALILHVTLAPLFAVSLTLLILFWAHQHRFDRSDWQPLLQRIRQKNSAPVAPQANSETWRKICFWLIVVLAVPLLISVILSMYPLFGTAGQEFLLHLHGYTALFMLIAVVGHSYLILSTTRRG